MDSNLFNYMEAINLGNKGKLIAANNKHELLKRARLIAVDIGRRKELVSIDDVVYEMDLLKLKPENLGNSSGSVFMKDSWDFTGQVIKSARIKTRGHLIRIWKLKEIHKW